MKKACDYSATIAAAKDLELIKDGDKYLFVTIQPKPGQNLGVAQEFLIYNYDVLLVVNKEEVKIIDVDKKTGELVGSSRIITKEEIKDLVASWFFGWAVCLHTFNKEDYYWFDLYKNFGKFYQADMLKDMVEFIKQEYTIPQKEARKAAKLAKKNKQ